MTARPLETIRQSTPLRLTGILLGVFVLSSMASFGSAYWVIRLNFDAGLHGQVFDMMASYRAITDPTDLVERLNSDIATLSPSETILSYLPDTGPRISNVTAFPPVAGFEEIPETAIRGDDLAESYLALSARVPSGELIVAQSRDQILETGEILRSVLLIGLLPTLVLAVAVGMIAARQAGAKLGAIEGVLTDLTGGRLSARVPITGRPDDLSRIGAAVNRMAHAQEASVAAIRQVSTDIAHDLKTPIQRVAQQLDRLSGKTALTADQAVIVADARDETDRIVKTFHALLQIAQIEGDNIRERFEPVDLAAVANDFHEIYGPAAEDGGHDLHLTVTGPGPFTVSGDRQLLGQVLANLIENGLRHVKAGGRIDVAVAARQGAVTLTVSDDGEGIPEGERENVLRRLYRLERSRTSEGNGLGLSLVAAICDLHGATLTLGDNAPGLVVRIVFSGA